MRTTKKEREENARRFYSVLRNGNYNNAAIVINRMNSSNPHISRCQFLAKINGTMFSEPVVLAESNIGLEGCFIEFIGAFYKGPQKTYHEQDFGAWLRKELGLCLTYNDGYVIMLERK